MAHFPRIFANPPQGIHWNHCSYISPIPIGLLASYVAAYVFCYQGAKGIFLSSSKSHDGRQTARLVKSLPDTVGGAPSRVGSPENGCECYYLHVHSRTSLTIFLLARVPGQNEQSITFWGCLVFAVFAFLKPLLCWHGCC